MNQTNNLNFTFIASTLCFPMTVDNGSKSVYCKVKVKSHDLTYGGSKVISSTHSYPRQYMEVTGNIHALG